MDALVLSLQGWKRGRKTAVLSNSKNLAGNPRHFAVGTTAHVLVRRSSLVFFSGGNHDRSANLGEVLGTCPRTTKNESDARMKSNGCSSDLRQPTMHAPVLFHVSVTRCSFQSRWNQFDKRS
ncbi:unnamed protein product, partial [Scytosiphon promiscuus]